MTTPAQRTAHLRAILYAYLEDEAWGTAVEMDEMADELADLVIERLEQEEAEV